MRAAEEPARRHLDEGEVVPAGIGESGRVVRRGSARPARRGRREARAAPCSAASAPSRGRDRGRRRRGPAPPRDARPAPGRRRAGTAARSRGSRRPSADGWCRGSRRSGPPAARRAGCPRSAAVKPFEARPEGRVRIRRHLRLQPDEVVHRRQRVERRALEEQLPLQRRPVERPCGDRVRHVRTLLACHGELTTRS